MPAPSSSTPISQPSPSSTSVQRTSEPPGPYFSALSTRFATARVSIIRSPMHRHSVGGTSARTRLPTLPAFSHIWSTASSTTSFKLTVSLGRFSDCARVK